jgi:S1-C subfamily serine protease
MQKGTVFLLLGLVMARWGFAQIGTSSAASPSQPLSFSGNGLAETTVFTTQNRWEVRWQGIPASISVEDVNGTILAGAGGIGGTLYMPVGGSFKLRVSPNNPAQRQWRVQIIQVGAAGQSIPNDGDVISLFIPPDMTMAGPVQTQPTMGGGTVQVGAPTAMAVPPNQPTAPIGTPSTPPVQPPVDPGSQKTLTAAQAAAIVLIRGDNAEGTGFLVRLPSGPVVVTNQHVIAANPHLQITTSAGALVKASGLEGAGDRDVALIPIQDNNYSYLEMATDVGNTVQVGDAIITPGNSEGGGVMLNTNGTVIALGPQKVEISNPVYHGNSGGPIFHLKSGKVIGVVTEGLKVDTTDPLDQASFQNRNSAITGTVRYFGLRLDTVANWQNYTWARFQNETEFLREFRERSMCLDSYLNTGINDTSDWGTYYARDEKIKEANQAIADMDASGDASTRIDTERNLVFSLSGLADADMDQIQQPSNFYNFDGLRARDEIAYRQYLKKEIDEMSDNVERLGGLARRAN